MNFWDERYSIEEYIYGLNPNEFFKIELKKLKPGKILLPAEGEGRNAVFAAKNKWEVFAFDQSFEGKKKAEKLASANYVKINYSIDTYESYSSELRFDCIALIYAHLDYISMIKYYNKLLQFLKPGGTLILEGFSEKQLKFNSGGPKSIDMLYSIVKLKAVFAELKIEYIEELEINLDEGKHHSGKASVIRLIAKK